MLNGKPVWTFAPNWDEGVLERLEWLTDILASATGVEQRRCMRLSPRREFEASFYIQQRERQLLDISLFQAGGSDWYIPLWAEVAHLGTTVAAGSTSLPIDPIDREYRVGDYVLLIGRDALTYETVEIASTDLGELQLIAPTANEWHAGSKAYPLRVGRLREAPTINKKTDTFSEVRTVWRLDDSPYQTADPGLPTYKSIPVLMTRPDESEDLSQIYERILHELDSNTGSVQTRDMAEQGITRQGYRWAITGRATYAALFRTLHLLRGRWRSVWLPTFFQDLTLSRPADSGDSEIYVLNSGYTGFGGDQAGRRDVAIQLRGGTTVFATITDSTNEGAEVRLTLESPLAGALTEDSILSISFMTLNRLDADSIEMSHKTDAAGVTVCAVTFKSTHAPRDESEWSPAPLLPYDGSGVSCMPPCPVPVSVDAPFADMPITYIPETQQVWTNSYWQDLALDPPALVLGYRHKASTLERLGDVVNDSPEGWPAGSPNGWYIDNGAPGYSNHNPFVHDPSRGVVWAVAAPMYGASTSDRVLLKFSSATGNAIKANVPFGIDMGQAAVFVNPVNDQVLLISGDYPDYSIHLIDPDTLEAVATTALGSYFDMHIAFAIDGSIRFMRHTGVDGYAPDEIFSLTSIGDTPVSVHTAPDGFAYWVTDNRNGRAWLPYWVGDNYELSEFDFATNELTGKVILMPSTDLGASNNSEAMYDERNDILWGCYLYFAEGEYTEFWRGYRASDGVYVGELSTTMTGGGTLDGVGVLFPTMAGPNAIFFTSSPDGGETTRVNRLDICRMVKP